jgi:putative ABC transport system permease protein
MSALSRGAAITVLALRQWLPAIGRDARFAWRTLVASPGLTALTAGTLALGLGATAAMVTAVNAAFLTPLPVADEQTLVKVYLGNARRSDIRVPLLVAQDWRRDARTLQATGAYISGIVANVSGGGEAVRARVARVTRPLFAAAGVAPQRGRLFDDDDIRPGATPVAVISHHLWQRVIASHADTAAAGSLDPAGRSIHIDGVPVPVIGVMPEGFSFPDHTDIWTAIERDGPPPPSSRTAHNFDVVARLAPGVSTDAAARELDVLMDAQRRKFPEMASSNHKAIVVALRDDLLGSHGRMVWIGLGAAICVLLVACVNVANLMFTRSLTRQGEISVRMALGASRAAIVRAVLVEGLILAGLGAAGGLVLAYWGLRSVDALAPDSVTGGRPLAIDLRVF